MAVEAPKAAQGLTASSALRSTEVSRRRLRRRQVRDSVEIWAPISFLCFLILACFVWPEIYTLRNPTASTLLHPNLPPLSPHYLLGTDPLGNDQLSRLLYGGRVSLEV